jgi:hypothetical protein
MADDHQRMVGPVIRGFDGADSVRSQAWSAALTRYALTARPDNLKPLTEWQHLWAPRAVSAVDGLAAVFATAPASADPHETTAGVTAATERYRSSCTTPPAPGP